MNEDGDATGQGVTQAGTSALPSNPNTSDLQVMFRLTSVVDSLVNKVNRKDLPEPEVFTHGTGRTLEDFFREFEQYAVQKYGPTEADWLPRLGKFLAGPLQRLYLCMRSASTDYATVKRLLLSSYGAQVGAKRAVDYIREFQQATYSPEEGIPGLVCRLRTLAEKAYQGLTADAVEELVKQQCWRVLPDHLRTPLHFQSLANPNMTLAELIRLGVALQRSDLTSAQVYTAKSTTPVGDSQPSRAAPQKPNPKLSRTGGASAPKMPKHCTHCDKKGHLREECYRLNKSCYGCGEKGHFRAQCPNAQPDGGTGLAVSSRSGAIERPMASRRSTAPRQQAAANQASAAALSGPTCSFCGAQGHLMNACPDFEDFMARLIERQLN